MTTPHNTHSTTCDSLGHFTSTDPEPGGTAPPTHSNTTSGWLDTPFKTSPYGFLPTELEGEPKEDSPNGADYTNPNQYKEPAPITHTSPITHAALPCLIPPHPNLLHQMT